MDELKHEIGKQERDKAILLMKEALFACLAAGLTEAKYGGVVVGEGKKAWMNFKIDREQG